MKHSVRGFKSLAIALKELQPYVLNGAHLQTGKPFKRLGGLRSRELLVNWLLCVVMTAEGEGDFYFTTDPLGGDGVICDARTGQTWPTEHVMVPDLAEAVGKSLEERILEQIRLKIRKGGEAYARGKTLLLFLNTRGGRWTPNRVLRRLPNPLYFDTIWIMGLMAVEDDEYIYGVTNLNLGGDNAPIREVRIATDFNSWSVRKIQ